MTNRQLTKIRIGRGGADSTQFTGEYRFYANEPGQKIIRIEQGTFINGLLDGENCIRKTFDKTSGRLVSLFSGKASKGTFSKIYVEYYDLKNISKVLQKFYGSFNATDQTFQGTTEYYDKHTGKIICKEIGRFQGNKLDGENCRREIYDKDSGEWIETATGRFQAGRFILRGLTNSPMTLNGYVS